MRLWVTLLAGFLLVGCNVPENQSSSPSPTTSARVVTTAELREVGVIHTFQAGDTLWSLANRYLGSGSRWTEIAELNGIEDETAIPDGTVLSIPSTKTEATTVTAVPTTNRVITTTTPERLSAEEKAYIDREFSGVVATAGLPITLQEGRCLLEHLVETHGIKGTEDLLDRFDTQLSSIGRVSASDADAFLQPFTLCADLVSITRRDLQTEAPEIDADCMLRGTTEAQIALWYRAAFSQGAEAMRAHVLQWMSAKLPLCM